MLDLKIAFLLYKSETGPFENIHKTIERKNSSRVDKHILFRHFPLAPISGFIWHILDKWCLI